MFDLVQLIDALRECAGDVPGLDITVDILDKDFDDLGYDSIARIETVSRIANEYPALKIDDDQIGDADTPRKFLELLNNSLATLPR